MSVSLATRGVIPETAVNYPDSYVAAETVVEVDASSLDISIDVGDLNVSLEVE